MMDSWILAALKEELESAKQRHQAAKENFWKVSTRLGELPRFTAGMLEPDSSPILRDAVAAERHALNAHLDALRRLNAYLRDGTIPEHLNEERKSIGQ